MPTSQKVQIDTFDFGASLTNPTLGALTTGTTISNGTANSCNEQSADSGVYIADFVGADASALIPAGTYRLRTTVNGLPLKRFVTFTGVDGELVYARSERAVELDPASVTAVQSGLATSSALTTVGNNVTAILEDTGTTIPAQISGLNNLSSAQVVSALGTGTWATAIPWNSSWDAEVQSEVQDAIETNNLDHLLKIAVDTNFATTVHLDSVIGHMADNGTSATFSRATDSLEAIRDNQASVGGASLEDIISGVQSVSGAIVEAQNSATLSIRIGDTWTQDIESLGDLTDKTVSFALKKRASDADTAAIVFIVEGTGLTKLNGAATTAGWGSITILDEVAGDIRLRLESNATSLLTSGSYVDAVKVLENGDDRTLRNAGRTVVSAGVIADIT